MRSIIIGAGTYGEVYLDYLVESGIEIVGFLDDNEEKHGLFINDIPVLGSTSLLETLQNTHEVEAVYCPIGNNPLRVRFLSYAKSLGYETPNYIHPSAIISPNVTIGSGVYVLLGSTIMPNVTIGNYVMISTGVHITHHTVLEQGTFLSTGCIFGASIIAHENSYCGLGSTIMTGIHELGKECLIGAGAVVIRDVPNFAVVAGVPAKVIKYKSKK